MRQRTQLNATGIDQSLLNKLDRMAEASGMTKVALLSSMIRRAKIKTRRVKIIELKFR